MGLFRSNANYIDPLDEAIVASDTALDVFVQAGRDLDAANERLDEVVTAAEVLARHANQRIAAAKAQQVRNNAVKVKIDDFVSVDESTASA